MRKCMVFVLGSFAAALMGFAEEPDFLADCLRSDGVGYVDTLYKYVCHCDDNFVTTQTSRVVVDFYTTTHGHGEVDGPTTTAETRTIFGYHDSTGISVVRYNGEGTWAQLGHVDGWFSFFGASTIGDNEIVIDYTTTKDMTWGSVTSAIGVPTADAARSYFVFALSHRIVDYQAPGAFDLKSLTFYERVGTAESTQARNFRPCCKEGKPGLYDTITHTIVYPNTTGFKVIGYDLTVAKDASLKISAANAAPRSLNLAADSTLVFTDSTTLIPENTVTLPAEGKITLSLETNDGSGRYVLISNLPADYALSSFQLGDLPKATLGTLSKEGTSLVLTLQDDGRVWPEALADTLSSDGAGYIDIGYKYHVTSYPKTARIVCNFYSYSNGKGKSPGPTISASARTIFGYQESSTESMFIARYSGDKVQFLYKGYKDFWAWCDGRQSHIDVNYLQKTAYWSWKDGAEWVSSNIVPSEVDSAIPYYLFANNCPNNRAALFQSVIDFQGLNIYETNDGETETLAHAYVPCANAGRYGVYDTIGCTIHTVENDTNCFSVANAKWRLRVNDEVLFLTGDVSFKAPGNSTAVGWVLMRDLDGKLLMRGSGKSASFTMPECGASLIWTFNETVESSSTRRVQEVTSLATLTLETGATLAFKQGTLLILSEGLSVPAKGIVTLDLEGITAAGTYNLIQGVADAIDLTKFVVSGLPAGLVGMVECQGDVLVVRVTGTSTEQESLPDCIVETLRGDGVGYFDTLYKYHASAYPKTARVTCDYYVQNWGRYGAREGADFLHSAIFGYQESTDQKESAAHIAQAKAQIMYRSGSYATWNGNGNSHIDINYVAETAFWSWNNGAENLSIDAPAATLDADYTYYLMANNCHDTRYRYPAIIDFKSLKFYETTDGTDEVLARNFVPGWKNARPCIYDTVTKTLCIAQNDTNGFSSTGTKWPTDIYTTMITQVFSAVETRSLRPVTTPTFAPFTGYTFVTDGTCILRENVDAVTVALYDSTGALLSSSNVAVNVCMGECVPITLDTAAKAVVTFSGAEAGVVTQRFACVSTTSSTEVLCRQMGSYAYEFMVSTETTFTALKSIESVWADAYDSSLALVGSSLLASGISKDGKFAVSIPNSAAYYILRVSVTPPGLTIFVR